MPWFDGLTTNAYTIYYNSKLIASFFKGLSMSALFKQKVLELVKQIPAGKTMTYSQVATLAGNPKAARAVGMIMSQNYNPEVPCHRVIRADGKMAGYNRGGITKKEQLLAQEKNLKVSDHSF